MDITASQTAQLTQVSRQTTNKLYARIRERIKEQCEYESPLKGEVEVDESYFGAKRVKGKAKAKEKANMPSIGLINSPCVESTSTLPTIGNVHENDTRASVAAMKKTPSKPPLSAC